MHTRPTDGTIPAEHRALEEMVCHQNTVPTAPSCVMGSDASENLKLQTERCRLELGALEALAGGWLLGSPTPVCAGAPTISPPLVFWGRRTEKLKFAAAGLALVQPFMELCALGSFKEEL